MTPRTVLLVEDDPLMSLALRRRLTVNGCDVVAAETMKEALAAAHATNEWLLFLVDLSLPDGGPDAGLKLLELLRERWPDVPAILMTAAEDLSLLVRAARVGAQYVPKGGGGALVAMVNLLRPRETPPVARLRERAAHHDLTPRETEVVLCVAQRGDVAAFCEERGMAPRTFRNHSANVVTKTGARSVKDFLLSVAYPADDLVDPTDA